MLGMAAAIPVDVVHSPYLCIYLCIFGPGAHIRTIASLYRQAAAFRPATAGQRRAPRGVPVAALVATERTGQSVFILAQRSAFTYNAPRELNLVPRNRQLK
jgi:hypothetical protein